MCHFLASNCSYDPWKDLHRKVNILRLIAAATLVVTFAHFLVVFGVVLP